MAIDAGGHAFQLYLKGVFSGICGKQLNHGVTIVGYGKGTSDKYWMGEEDTLLARYPRLFSISTQQNQSIQHMGAFKDVGWE